MYTTNPTDDPNRVNPPDDYEEFIGPECSDLFAILEDDIIFWEAYSVHGIKIPYHGLLNDYQHARNTGVYKDFEHDVRLAIATQDFESLGRAVSAKFLEYAAGIYENRQMGINS